MNDIAGYSQQNKTICWTFVLFYHMEFIAMPTDCDEKHICEYMCEVTHSSGAVTNATQINVHEAECPPGQFQCTDSSCILDIYMCDGQGDCVDKSDEDNVKCQHDILFLVCDKNELIPLSFTCDGRKQCTNDIDETNCPPENEDSLSQYEQEQFTNCSRCSNIIFPDLLKADLQLDCSCGEDEEELLQMSGQKFGLTLPNKCPDGNYRPCLKGHSTCYHFTHTCIFDMNKYGRIAICSNGPGHILSTVKCMIARICTSALTVTVFHGVEFVMNHLIVRMGQMKRIVRGIFVRGCSNAIPVIYVFTLKNRVMG